MLDLRGQYALSVDSGSMLVSWQIRDGMLDLHDGPAKQDFGSALVENTIASFAIRSGGSRVCKTTALEGHPLCR